MPDETECDATVIISALVAFALPLTLLLPEFSVWEVIPKFHITRFHIISLQLTWSQLNAAVVSILTILFCFYLEIRKRKLDDMVEKVLSVSQATDVAMAMEQTRQADATRGCVELLDSSAEHYENLMMLRDELKKRDQIKKQHPPEIEASSIF